MPGSKAKRKDPQPAQDPRPTTAQRTPWPSLDPLVPTQDLELHSVLPGQIVTISNFWTASLCKKYVNFLAGLPLATTPGKPKKGEAVRVNDRFQIDDVEFAESLWSRTGLRELIANSMQEARNRSEDGESVAASLWGGEVVGLNPNIRIYRYRKGQFFDQHYDESNTLMHPGPPPTPAKTTWTLLLYLTSPTTGCVGGETVFYPDPPPPPPSKKGKKGQGRPEPVVVALETGMALLHKHGNDCLLHEGREVLEGEKWVIRSDLCVKR